MRGIRRFALTSLAVLGLACGGELITAAPSLAGLSYTSAPNAVLGEAGSGNGQLSEPVGVAVDDANGTVYVADKGNNRVQDFDATGQYLGQFDGSETPAKSLSDPAYIAVDNSASAAKGDIYVVDVGHAVIDVFSPAGKYLSQLTGIGTKGASELRAVAVGAGGEVWVYYAEEETGYVDEFSAAGGQLAAFGTGYGTQPGFAVDSAGDMYLLFGCGCVGKFQLTSASSAEQVGGWATATGTALAVSPSSNNVFMDTGYKIEEFGPFGEPYGSPISTFATEGLSESHGLAVDGATGTVYASQRGANSVDIFKFLLLADVSTGPASGVGKTAATLSGTVKREGLATKYYFQYGESPAYGSDTPVGNVTGEAEEVTANLSGLPSGVTYHYRLVAENANGVSDGEDRTFTTPPAVDGVQTEVASSVGKIGATLSGSLAPDGLDAHYYFEYGESQSYGSAFPVLPGVDAGSASKIEHAEVALTGLKGNTTYHYRIVAINAIGATYGEDMTFTTLPAVDSVQTEGATGISATAATMSGALAPDGLDTHYYFEYGESESYGSTSPLPPGTDAGEASQVEHVETALTGLQPHTAYHYRIAAVNSLGATYGEDGTFTTYGAIATVNDQSPTVSNVTRTTALVNGTIDSENSSAAIHVEYVAADAYAPAAADPYFAGASSQSHVVEALHGDQTLRPLPLEGLLPSTTYHYRLVASNAVGVAYGSDYTFTTAAATPPGVQVGPASAVTQTTATLSGAVEAQGLQTSYEFEVGIDTSYSGAKLFGNAGQSAASEPVSAGLQFLVPGTTYHYRLVATNADGTTYGPDMTFTTPGVSSPIGQPPTTQLIPSPTVQFPSVSGAITKPRGSTKSKHKAKKQKAKSRKRTKRRRTVAKRGAKKGGRKGK
jgi:phosphodiesterase/alkaline phosphatase D-like protein